MNKVLGTYHADDLVFVFDNQWPPVLSFWNKEDHYIASVFGYFFSNFIWTHNPNNINRTKGRFFEEGAMPSWPRYELEKPLKLVVDVPASLESGISERHCDFWDELLRKGF